MKPWWIIAKQVVEKVTTAFIHLMPLKDVILFESHPDFSDSPIRIYNELVKKGYDKKYRLIWICHKRSSVSDPKIERINCVNFAKNYYYQHRAKYIIFNNYLTGIKRKGQKAIYMSHGAPVKDTSKYFWLFEPVTSAITIAPIFNEALAHSLKLKIEQISGVGYPRNDVLLESNVDLHRLLNFNGKIIFYYPTVKVWKIGPKHGSATVSNLLVNDDDYSKLNDYLIKTNTLIVMKLHWSSGGREILKKVYSNIKFVDESFFNSKSVTSYECLAKADALLTDYSSVFCDYLAINRPIGFIWTDFDEYKKNPGLSQVFEDTLAKCGEKIYTMDGLYKFIDNVNNGIDPVKQDRETIAKLMYPYPEKEATSRVADYVIKTFGL